MPLTTNHPEPAESGEDYGELLASINITGLVRGTSVAAAANAKFRPYRVNADTGAIELADAPARKLLIGDAFTAAQDDPALAAFVSGFMQLLQELIDAKNL